MCTSRYGNIDKGDCNQMPSWSESLSFRDSLTDNSTSTLRAEHTQNNDIQIMTTTDGYGTATSSSDAATRFSAQREDMFYLHSNVSAVDSTSTCSYDVGNNNNNRVSIGMKKRKFTSPATTTVAAALN